MYLNGIKDIEYTKEKSSENKIYQILIGKDSVYHGLEGYLDEMNIYEDSLEIDEIIQSNNLQDHFGNIADIFLGGLELIYEEAVNKCIENFHLCTLQEIYTFGY